MKANVVVLVPLDGTREAAAALPSARRAAEIIDATIILLHVVNLPVAAETLMDRLGIEDEDMRGCLLESVVAETPADGIAARAESPDVRLVVMATHAAKTAEGGVTEQVVNRCSRPVLVVHPPGPGFRPARRSLTTGLRILVPHDASPPASAAMQWGARLAHRGEGSLDVLHVAMAGADFPGVPGSLPLGPYADGFYDLQSWMREFLDRFCMPACGPLGVQPELHLRRGELAPEIIRFAKENEIDLIVLAWRGNLTLQCGEVIRTLLARTPCPLLFVTHSLEEGPQNIILNEAAAGLVS